MSPPSPSFTGRSFTRIRSIDSLIDSDDSGNLIGRATLALELSQNNKRRRVSHDDDASSVCSMDSLAEDLFDSISAINEEVPFPTIAWTFDDDEEQ